MEKIEIEKLYDYDFTLNTVNALKQFWTDNNTFDCIGKPKKYNMLLYFNNCKARYLLKNGEIYYADSGSIVYTPLNSEYKVEFFDLKDSNSYTIGVNFLLYNSSNNPFVLSDGIKIFNADNSDYKSLFNKLSHYSEANIICIAKIKSLLYDVIFKLSSFYHMDFGNKFRCISKGIDYLENDENQLFTISQIADTCNVSEVYFRKLFKEYSGTSPIEFRTKTKIFRAKNYLKSDDLTISEISDRLGYDDVSYFIKTFREYVGITPNKYRKKHINN